MFDSKVYCVAICISCKVYISKLIYKNLINGKNLFVIAKKKTTSGSLRRKSALSRNRKTPITLSLILSTYARSNDFLSASPHSKFRTETCSVSCSILPQLRFMTLISLSAAESIPKLNLLSCNSASVPSSKRCTRFGKSSIHRLPDPAS